MPFSSSPFTPVFLWALALHISHAHGFATSQYEEFFPAWSGMLKFIRDTNCTAEFNAFHNSTIYPGYSILSLPDCLLSNIEPTRQVEMSIVSILFGLLPTILIMIGPSPAEISQLAIRRPILALLLAIPMPSVRLPNSDMFQELALFQQKPVEVETTVRVGFFAKPPIWVKVLLSICEYTVAGVAVANMAIQVYQLAFWAIALSAVAITSGRLPKTYAPFLWIVLIAIVHIITFITMNLRYKEHPGRPKSLLQWVKDEITPCVYGDPVRLVQKKLEQKKDSYFYKFCYYWAKMGIVILFIYATIFLSSTIFISLGDAVTVVARFFVASVICRWVLLFELHGMEEVASQTSNTLSSNDVLSNDT